MTAAGGQDSEPVLTECRICWHRYDPATGDELGQIPAGTPFADLPDDWRCPECDADKGHYLPWQ